MSVPQIVAEILDHHVTFELECIDRMYLNVYIPGLQCESGVVKFFRRHRGHPYASSALMDPMTKTFVGAIERFAKQEQIPVVQFRKGQRKDDIMAEHLARFDKPEGVVLLGKAQEKTPVFRTEKRRNPETGKTYPWIIRSTAMINQYYWYCLDRDFGPFFVKFASYFPYNAKLCLNELIFDRRVSKRTPGRFRTRVLTAGVIPSLHVDYKNSRIKQYFKQVPDVREVGARTETTNNNTRDFSIGKRLCNLAALRQVGFQANRRLLEVQRLSHECAMGEQVLH